MGLLNPIWLWGLLGLAVPVVIHLLSRKDMRVVRIGSLRHLQDGTTRQAIRIHMRNYLLLALRCLILAATALLLAGLYFQGGGKPSRWILVEGNLADDEPWRAVVDSLEDDGYELRRLQSGFPLVAASSASASVPDYWKLSEALTHVQLDRCVVISRSQQSGFAGLRPLQDSRVTWHSSEPDSSRFTLAFRQERGDSARTRIGYSNGNATRFDTKYLAASEVASAQQDAQQNLMKSLRIVVSGTNVDAEEKRVVTAALRALDTDGWVSLDIRESAPAEIGDGDWLIWLSPDAPPSTGIKYAIVKESNGSSDNTLWLHADMLSREAARETTAHSGFERLWTLAGPITMQKALREHLTLQLANVLFEDVNNMLNRTSSQKDQRQMPEAQMFVTRTAESIMPAAVPARHASGHWVAILLMALLLTERWIANRQQL